MLHFSYGNLQSSSRLSMRCISPVESTRLAAYTRPAFQHLNVTQSCPAARGTWPRPASPLRPPVKAPCMTCRKRAIDWMKSSDSALALPAVRHLEIPERGYCSRQNPACPTYAYQNDDDLQYMSTETRVSHFNRSDLLRAYLRLCRRASPSRLRTHSQVAPGSINCGYHAMHGDGRISDLCVH